MKKGLYTLILVSMLVGCTTKEIQIVTTPANSTVTVTGSPQPEVTRAGDGTIVKIAPSSNPYRIRAEARNFESVVRNVEASEVRTGDKIQIDLPRLKDTRSFVAMTSPKGATVEVDGQVAGVTPVQVQVNFSRNSSRDEWSTGILRYKLDGWEEAESKVTINTPMNLPETQLKRLVHPIPFSLEAQTAKGETLQALVKVNGEAAGTTPLIKTLLFERKSSDQSWPEFTVEIGIPDQYKTRAIKIGYDSKREQTVELDPVSELAVQRAFPIVSMTANGARLQWDESVLPGSVETGENLSTVRDLRALTDFDRRNPKKPCVNSFVVTPDSQQLIYGVTLTSAEGRYSNLWQSSAQMLSTGRRQITEGPYLDTDPDMGASSEAVTVVFQSNRGFRDSIDISSIRIVDNRVLGGIRQLTREQRFNYSPVYTNEAWELFFVSLEERFPLAKPQISFMGLDGALPTYLSENGEELALSPGGDRVFFNRIEPSTGHQQIYSIPKEGRPLTQVITRSAFMSANCFSPNVSPNGKSLLFVSDIDRDEQDRKNNNIYLLNLETGDISPVTQNFSDDIDPVWSPTEPNVLFFISNRGGCYNIWRMELSRLE